jgi:hypothetical protein
MTSGLPWGLALSSGVNTYLPLFLLALLARCGHVVHLSPRFSWLVSDQAIFILGLLAVCEVLAQKFPVLDNAWDFVHTLLRPLAGALAAGATLSTDSAAETLLALLMGGTLAAAAHSTKSSIRLMSTSKSFGTANFVISIGEDAAVLAGTLLSVYAPWVMLGVVLVFVLAFALVGPRLLRTLFFDVRILGGWLAWLFKRMLRVPSPTSLQESLLELGPGQLSNLGAPIEAGEELSGMLAGWERTRGGPRRTWLLLTSRRLLWVESRLFRKAKVRTLDYRDVSVARIRNLILFCRIDVLNRQCQGASLSLSKSQSRFAEMAAGRIRELAGLTETAGAEARQSAPSLVSVQH